MRLSEVFSPKDWHHLMRSPNEDRQMHETGVNMKVN